MQNQQTCMTSWAQPCPQPISKQPAAMDLSPSSSRGLSRLKRRAWTTFSLPRFGIHHQSSVQCLLLEGRNKHNSRINTDDVISQRHEVLVAWTHLKFGLAWNHRYPYGSIATSLSVYPVIKSFLELDCNLFEMFRHANICEVQQLFSANVLHPHTRDEYGNSLLHVRKS